jgi:nucleoside-diphosphate-sugar epimerase
VRLQSDARREAITVSPHVTARCEPLRALVTGGAGFIGSHLVDALVAGGHDVVVLDDLTNGCADNVHHAANLIRGSVTDLETVQRATTGCDTVFHLAALGAVPRSLRDPLASDLVNVHGTITLLKAAMDASVRRVIYASSSSVYGGATVLPTPETVPARPRSPYAASKLGGEWYCRVFAENFDIETVSLRYFNVFGPRQRPDATYAAVIPLFTAALYEGRAPTIFGDGEQSRDFTYVDDVVAANLAAAAAPAAASGNVYNIAPGSSHTVRELLTALCDVTGIRVEPQFTEARTGDVKQSCADATAAERDLGWCAHTPLRDGLERYVSWFRERAER